MRKNFYYFSISFIITACILVGFTAICTAYQNIVKTAYGETKSAIEIERDGIRILDFEYKILGNYSRWVLR
ncbi:MAG: hypothetical protein J5659_01970 [Clostridia bacterium]|nr:hypothetical protein [Clostridia bacterium]